MPFDLIVPRRPGRFSKEFARFFNEHSTEDPIKNRKVVWVFRNGLSMMEKWPGIRQILPTKSTIFPGEFDRFRANSSKCSLKPRIGRYECQNLTDFGQMSGLARSIFAQNRSNVRLKTEVSCQNNFMPSNGA